eukprot:g6256.t1
MDWIFDIIFLFDLGLNFFTPYQIPPRDEWYTQPRLTAFHYARTWFIVDAISSIPLDRFVAAATGSMDVDSAAKTSSVVKVSKLARLTKNLRLLRIARVYKLVKQYLGRLQDAGQMIRLFMFFIFCAHCLGCLFLFVSNNFPPNADSVVGTWSFLHNVHPYQNVLPGRQYAAGMYSAVLMLFGADVFPETTAEIFVVIFIMILGAVIHATLFGQISHIIAKFNETSTRRTQKLAMVMQNLTTMSVSDPVIIERVIRYYSFLWDVTQFHRRDDFLKELSPCLRAELNLLLNGEMVRRVELFSQFHGVSLIDVVGMLSTTLFLGGDFVIYEGSYGTNMYFVRVGRCEVFLSAQPDQVLAEKNPGDHFGEIVMLLPDTRRTANVIAAENCELSTLEYDDFRALADKYPELQQDITQKALTHTRTMTNVDQMIVRRMETMNKDAVEEVKQMR